MDKNDLARLNDFVRQKVYDLLLAAQATGSVYLFLDDDSLVLERKGIEDGLHILKNEPSIG